MKQCALHTVAASLVRESGAIHSVRANAGFDVPLEDSVCLDGVSGNLQVDAGLIGCMRCWRLRLRRPWWLSLIGCTTCRSARLCLHW